MWSVTPSLHTPLMSVTNAISSVIIVGAIIAALAGTSESIFNSSSIFGFIAIIYFLFHSPPGVTGEIMKQSMSLSESLNLSEGLLKGISSLSGCLGASVGQGLISHTFVSTIGVFYGALVSALMAKEFKIRTPNDPKRYIQSLGGGIMMGFSASLGIGCTIGAFFSAVSSLSLSGWVFGLSLFIGSFVGTKIIKAIG